MAKYLDENGLLYFWQQLKSMLSNKVDKETGMGLSSNDFTSEDKTKLDGIATGAQVNQNAFSTISVGGTNIEAGTITDTLNLTAGDNITLTPNATTDTIEISSAGKAYTGTAPITVTGDTITHDNSGVSAASKGDTANQTPAFGGTFKVTSGTVNATGHLTAYADHTVTIPSDTATTSAPGLMSKDDKTKLNGIDAGAEVNVINGITVNGEAATVTNKTAAITVPTKTSELSNDSGYITSEDVPDGATASTTVPKMDGTATAGKETAFARGDHVHPTDTSRAPLASPDFTGTPTAPTAVAGTNTTQVATTAFVQTAVSGKQNTLTFDSTPTSGSTNPVTSGGVYSALDLKLSISDADDTYAKKSDITGTYKFKGSVATVSALPETGNTTGDVYDVTATGMNYAWTGEKWDALGEVFTIEAISNSDIDNIIATAS